MRLIKLIGVIGIMVSISACSQPKVSEKANEVIVKDDIVKLPTAILYVCNDGASVYSNSSQNAPCKDHKGLDYTIYNVVRKDGPTGSGPGGNKEKEPDVNNFQTQMYTPIELEDITQEGIRCNCGGGVIVVDGDTTSTDCGGICKTAKAKMKELGLEPIEIVAR